MSWSFSSLTLAFAKCMRWGVLIKPWTFPAVFPPKKPAISQSMSPTILSLSTMMLDCVKSLCWSSYPGRRRWSRKTRFPLQVLQHGPCCWKYSDLERHRSGGFQQGIWAVGCCVSAEESFVPVAWRTPSEFVTSKAMRRLEWRREVFPGPEFADLWPVLHVSRTKLYDRGHWKEARGIYTLPLK